MISTNAQVLPKSDNKISDENKSANRKNKIAIPRRLNIFDPQIIVDVLTFSWLKDSHSCYWNKENHVEREESYVVVDEDDDDDGSAIFQMKQLQGLKVSYISQFMNTGGKIVNPYII